MRINDPLQQFDEGLQVLQKDRLAEAAAVLMPQIGFSISPSYLLLFIASLVLGYVVSTVFELLKGMFAFWFVNVYILHWLVAQFRSVVRYPLNIYPFFIQAICTFLLPYAFINYFPSLLLFEKIGMTEGIVLFCCGILVSALMVALPVWMFSRGLRRYESGNG